MWVYSSCRCQVTDAVTLTLAMGPCLQVWQHSYRVIAYIQTPNCSLHLITTEFRRSNFSQLNGDMSTATTVNWNECPHKHRTHRSPKHWLLTGWHSDIASAVYSAHTCMCWSVNVLMPQWLPSTAPTCLRRPSPAFAAAQALRQNESKKWMLQVAERCSLLHEPGVAFQSVSVSF